MHDSFQFLLQEVALKFQQEHPEINAPIQEWKGEDIALFREELYQAVAGSISEKWFYTHVKTRQEKLPRIDTINLLAKYAGYQSWKGFLHHLEQQEGGAEENQKVAKESISSKNIEKQHMGKRQRPIHYIIVISLLLLLLTFVVGKGFFGDQKKYTFCFIDQNTKRPVMDSLLEVRVERKGESPQVIPLSTHCYEGKGDFISFQVEGRYYKPLKIRRSIHEDGYQELIMLVPDDYAMMIHLFSHAKVDDWKRRREQLGEMFHEEARIYQVSEEGYGMDIYNKIEFINKLTLPTRGLKNIEILSKEYKGERISKLRFIQR